MFLNVLIKLVTEKFETVEDGLPGNLCLQCGGAKEGGGSIYSGLKRVEVPKKEEEVSTQPETVVQEDATTVVAPEEVKTEEKDASSAKKEEEPVNAEVGSNHKPPSHIQHAQADQPCIHSVQLLASFDGASPLKQTISSDLVEVGYGQSEGNVHGAASGFRDHGEGVVCCAQSPTKFCSFFLSPLFQQI
ncbi:hypothetical protein NC653_030144 [Populus alba x Populus x berolinensis]|uniref:Uncharacterized protein n=1 Tax=Populus alba x Populus x berolinensis TaxID=444605 RepID=A0AAD6LVD7_9ROSI|nr:hypothetical protein NC653_030144 [Populus alba x Populus x berolinensis]